MENILNLIIFIITILLIIFSIIKIVLVCKIETLKPISNFYNKFIKNEYLLLLIIIMFLSWYFYVRYSYFMLKKNNNNNNDYDYVIWCVNIISFTFIALTLLYLFNSPDLIYEKILYMFLLVYLIIFIINLIFQYNNLDTDFSKIIVNENYRANFVYNCTIPLLLIPVLFLKKDNKNNFYYRTSTKILIFILLSIFLQFLFYISIYIIQNIYKSKSLSKEYKKKLINLNNNLGLNDNNQENHSIDKNAIKFYDPIDKDNINFINIFNDKFDTKHNLDKDDTELYSQNQYRKYYNKIKQKLKELNKELKEQESKIESEKDTDIDEILIELHNFLILHIPVTFNYSDFIKNSKLYEKDFIKNSKLSEEELEKYKKNIETKIESKLSDLKIENNEYSVYFKEINKNYKYINGQAGEIKTMILNNTPDNNNININMLLIGYNENENETVMNYETFINKVPAKNYACAYLNYFNNYDYGGIDTDKFEEKYNKTDKDKDKVNKINNIFEIDFIDINKNIKIEKYIIALVISIITGIIFITIIFKFIKEQNIIKNPEFYSLIIIILFIIAFILGEVIFSRI